MLIPSIVFAVLSLVLAIFVGRRVLDIRNGKINIVGKEFAPLVSLDSIDDEFDAMGKKMNVHFFRSLGILIAEIIFFYRKAHKAIGDKVHKFLEQLPHYPPEGYDSHSSSFFLKDISAHKEEVRKENGYHKEQ